MTPKERVTRAVISGKMRAMVEDEVLARGAASGDAEAFRVLLERHYDRMFRLSYRILGSRADAEDLAQDVAIALPAKLRGFRGEARFTTWLHRVIVNGARDMMRRHATRRRAGEGWGDTELLRRADNAAETEAKDWLSQAMSSLKPDLRETVALVLGEDLTHAGAAEILGISEGTVSWRMAEVRKILRAQARNEEIVE